MATIAINADGTVQFIYSDGLAGLFNERSAGGIRRASHVEPTPEGQWTADMRPVNGPVLGPYKARAEALAAEVTWLEANYIK